MRKNGLKADKDHFLATQSEIKKKYYKQTFKKAAFLVKCAASEGKSDASSNKEC